MDFTEKKSREAVTRVGDDYAIAYAVNYSGDKVTNISGHIRKGNLLCGNVLFTDKNVSLNISTPDGEKVPAADFDALLKAFGSDIIQLFNDQEA